MVIFHSVVIFVRIFVEVILIFLLVLLLISIGFTHLLHSLIGGIICGSFFLISSVRLGVLEVIVLIFFKFKLGFMIRYRIWTKIMRIFR